MEASLELQRERLLQALERLDADSRPERAQRVEWLSLHEPERNGITMGRTETMHVLRETREVFINGHFVAALLLAMAFIEHIIVEELQQLGHTKGSPKFSSALDLAASNKVFPSDWLVRAKTLSLRRNPFAHLKESAHSHALGRRARLEQRHPRQILEDDAKDAVDLMYNFYVATLRVVSGPTAKEA